jgi:hypothetical protein
MNEIDRVEEDQPNPIKLLALWEVGRLLGSDQRRLEKWVKDPEIKTPAPRFNTGSKDHWTLEDMPAWEAFYTHYANIDLSLTMTKLEMVDALVLLSKRVLQNAERASHGDRSYYPKGEARNKVHQLEGVLNFVSSFGEMGIEPKSKREEISSNLRGAQRFLGMN